MAALVNIHEPITNYDSDKLMRQPHIKKFVARLAGEDCPSVIGLYGSWGTGKTSFLYMAKDHYENKLAGDDKAKLDNSLTIEIVDAWRYERVGDLMVPVMARLQKLCKNIDRIKAATLTVLAATPLAIYHTQ